MRLYRDPEVPVGAVELARSQDAVSDNSKSGEFRYLRHGQGLMCRQSRLAGVVRFVLFSGALAAPPVLGWKFHYPWLLWGGLILAAIVIPLLLMDTARLFRATNWKLGIGSDGVSINLRSYRDKPSEKVSVV